VSIASGGTGCSGGKRENKNFYAKRKRMFDVHSRFLIKLKRRKNMKMLHIFFLSCLFIFASSAWAAVYKWVDERGVLNLVDDYSKVPPDYRNKAEEVNISKVGALTPSQVPPGQIGAGAQPGEVATQTPSIAQPLIREGDFAIKLAGALKVGRAQSEAEAENMLALAGITPRNGWIADYPVTPDIIGELQNAIGSAVDSGKLAMKGDEAIKVFQDLIAQQGLPVRADERQYAGSEGPAEPPPSEGDYSDYYYDEGPPIVTYYAPPWDYYYMYAWVPYPFWYSGFWFPGFFCLHDFHRGFFVNGQTKFISNHFWDSGGRRFGTIDPARRHMGNAMANISRPAGGFSSPLARNGASSILTRSSERAGLSHSMGGISSNRGSSGLSNFRGGVSAPRPSMGYGSRSTGYSSSRGVPLGRPTYGSSFSHWGGFSHPGMGTGRSFSSPSMSGSFGFHGGGGFGSRGFSGGGGRGGGRGGGGRR